LNENWKGGWAQAFVLGIRSGWAALSQLSLALQSGEMRPSGIDKV
jgi:hypothetical protein